MRLRNNDEAADFQHLLLGTSQGWAACEGPPESADLLTWQQSQLTSVRPLWVLLCARCFLAPSLTAGAAWRAQALAGDKSQCCTDRAGAGPSNGLMSQRKHVEPSPGPNWAQSGLIRLG